MSEGQKQPTRVEGSVLKGDAVKDEANHRAGRRRSQAAELIMNHMSTIAHALYYFHRFWATVSPALAIQWDPYLIAAAALLIAGKSTESVRKLKDVVSEFLLFRVKDPEKRKVIAEDVERAELYNDICEDILVSENELLHVINFEFEVDVPHSYLLEYYKYLRLERDVMTSVKFKKFLDFPAPVIAVASIVVFFGEISPNSSRKPPEDWFLNRSLNPHVIVTKDGVAECVEVMSKVYRRSQMKKPSSSAASTPGPSPTSVRSPLDAAAGGGVPQHVSRKRKLESPLCETPTKASRLEGLGKNTLDGTGAR